jgi:hypothetical protein
MLSADEQGGPQGPQGDEVEPAPEPAHPRDTAERSALGVPEVHVAFAAGNAEQLQQVAQALSRRDLVAELLRLRARVRVLERDVIEMSKQRDAAISVAVRPARPSPETLPSEALLLPTERPEPRQARGSGSVTW